MRTASVYVRLPNFPPFQRDSVVSFFRTGIVRIEPFCELLMNHPSRIGD